MGWEIWFCRSIDQEWLFHTDRILTGQVLRTNQPGNQPILPRPVTDLAESLATSEHWISGQETFWKFWIKSDLWNSSHTVLVEDLGSQACSDNECAETSTNK